jgi:hypothetical protein
LWTATVCPTKSGEIVAFQRTHVRGEPRGFSTHQALS